jgi:hypothetical protein
MIPKTEALFRTALSIYCSPKLNVRIGMTTVSKISKVRHCRRPCPFVRLHDDFNRTYASSQSSIEELVPSHP